MERLDKDQQVYRTKKTSNSKFVLGIVLIGAGVLVMLRSAGLLPPIAREIFFSWQMILIAIGTVLITTKGRNPAGFILVGIGVVFLIPEIVYIPYEFRRLSWGLILVIAGLFFIFRFRSGSSGKHTFSYHQGTNANDVIDDVSIFGGGEKIIHTNSFKGGDVVAIFGGSTIDLSKSELAEGTHVLECVNIFGGTKFIVPPHWNVKVEVTSILGGFSDERRNFTGNGTDNSKLLIIKGVAIFGGGEIKSF